MELLVIGLVGGLIAAVWFARRALGRIDKDKAAAVERSGADLDAAFDGRDFATYKVTPATISTEVVMQGANERGYVLQGQTSEETAWGAIHTLAFAKRT
ncbi:hypothetical protein [Demequina sp. SO4-18]|uniref:hypothetical protein n=1 Tax=Demequina sp. SO4-18 TaxID=3401026 RepID=UPI003B5AA42C